jgi:hypothetical protein
MKNYTNCIVLSAFGLLTAVIFLPSTAVAQRQTRTALTKDHYERYCLDELFPERHRHGSSFFNSPVYVDNTTGGSDGWRCNMIVNVNGERRVFRRTFHTDRVCQAIFGGFMRRTTVRRENWSPEGWVCYH